jgi:hypothetical protein
MTWVLLLGGGIWFGFTSPKTPLQFFDAANRDESAIDTRTAQRSDPIPSNRAQTLQTLKSVNQAMNRMALSYDITRDPASVQLEQSSILMGFYDASPQTREALMQNNDSYRSLAEQFEKLRMDLKASRDLISDSSASRHPQEEDKNQRMKRFQSEMDRMTIRKFQAKLFWRGHP